MEFAIVTESSLHTEETPQLHKYYKIYIEYYSKYGRAWARKVGQFEKRRHDPFSRVNREVNSALRRFLGSDVFTQHIDMLEFMVLRDGILVKDPRSNTLDIPESTFNDWLGL